MTIDPQRVARAIAIHDAYHALSMAPEGAAITQDDWEHLNELDAQWDDLMLDLRAAGVTRDGLCGALIDAGRPDIADALGDDLLGDNLD